MRDSRVDGGTPAGADPDPEFPEASAILQSFPMPVLQPPSALT